MKVPWVVLTVSIQDIFCPFPGGSDGKEFACNVEDPGSTPGSGRFPGEWNGNWPGKLHGQRSLVGYSPWGHKVRHDWATNTCPSRVLITLFPNIYLLFLQPWAVIAYQKDLQIFFFFLLTDIFDSLLKCLWALKTPRKTFLFIWSAINFGSWHCRSAWAAVNYCHLAERAGFPNCSSLHSINSLMSEGLRSVTQATQARGSATTWLACGKRDIPLRGRDAF